MPREWALELTEIPLARRGKVRDIYDLGDSLLFIASDRISAFDVVMPNGIPGHDSRACRIQVESGVSLTILTVASTTDGRQSGAR